MQNHVIDPTYFYDVIEEFAFNYDWYSEASLNFDDLGRKVTKYNKLTIRGSLQPKTNSWNQSLNGNTHSMTYDFYCKSLYRININDFIKYKHRFLVVTDVDEYDEYGVRHVTLKMINLNQYKDFQESLKYLDGEIIV